MFSCKKEHAAHIFDELKNKHYFSAKVVGEVLPFTQNRFLFFT